VRVLPEVTRFEARGATGRTGDLGAVELSLDELEALRLADLQGRSQADAAARMGVSRATFGRVVASARGKVASALVQGRTIHIEGGPVAVDPNPEGGRMKLAIASNPHDIVARHFGKSAKFMIYTIEGGQVVATEARDNPHRNQGHRGPMRGHGGFGHGHGRGGGHGGYGFGHGHQHGHGHDCAHDEEGKGWVADTLGDCTAVVTAGIGSGAVTQLRRAGIRLVLLDRPTSLDDAVKLFAEGRL